MIFPPPALSPLSSVCQSEVDSDAASDTNRKPGTASQRSAAAALSAAPSLSPSPASSEGEGESEGERGSSDAQSSCSEREGEERGRAGRVKRGSKKHGKRHRGPLLSQDDVSRAPGMTDESKRHGVANKKRRSMSAADLSSMGEGGQEGQSKRAEEREAERADQEARKLWGNRMTKAAMVPPVTRQYDVIEEYVIVEEKESVLEKMKVDLPGDYEDRVKAAQASGQGQRVSSLILPMQS